MEKQKKNSGKAGAQVSDVMRCRRMPRPRIKKTPRQYVCYLCVLHPRSLTSPRWLAGPRMSLRPLTRSLRPFSTRPPPPPPRRLPAYVRRTGLLAAGLGAAYLLDRQYNASSVARTLRTLHTVRPPCPPFLPH